MTVFRHSMLRLSSLELFEVNQMSVNIYTQVFIFLAALSKSKISIKEKETNINWYKLC